MKLELQRFSSGEYDTLGLLLERTTLGRRFLCFTLEDEARAVKVKGETRIPAGTYRLDLRRAGGLHTKYAELFPFHRGMLWLVGVPGFEWVYLHIGNDEDDTAGCPLVGDQVLSNVLGPGKLLYSSRAYQRIYPSIASAIEVGGEVTLDVVDGHNEAQPESTR